MAIIESNKISDEELYIQLGYHDNSAYYQLFERYWEHLYTIAFRILNDQEAAKDIVQEIFLQLWKNRTSVQIKNVAAYLSRAAKFSALKNIRDDHFSDSLSLDTISNIGLPNNDQLEFEEMQQLVEQAIDKLPTRCKEVFLLSRKERMTNDEIAKKLHLSKRTVETHISHALKHLKSVLPKHSFILAIPFLF